MTRPTALLFLFTIVCAVSLAACSPTTQSTNTDPTTAPVAAADANNMRSPVSGEKMLKSQQTYSSPAGDEKVAFTIYVDASGVVTEAVTTVEAKAPISVTRQKSFASELPSVIKGKKLSELTKIDRVGGSSLTTGAFNKALTDLKTQI